MPSGSGYCAALLTDHVLLFFEEHKIPLLGVVTDRGESCSAPIPVGIKALLALGLANLCQGIVRAFPLARQPLRNPTLFVLSLSHSAQRVPCGWPCAAAFRYHAMDCWRLCGTPMPN